MASLDYDMMEIDPATPPTSMEPDQALEIESRERVFDTTEVLEMIFSWLPLPSLLRVQAVSKHWQNLIESSSTLQQQLFFKPEKVDKLWLARINNLPAQQNPLRRDFKTGLRVLREVPPNSDALKTFHGLIAIPVRINEIFLRYDPFLRVPEDIDQRNMLLTQPPVTHLCVEVLVHRRSGEDIAVGLTFRQSGNYGLYSAKIVEPGGVRLHQISEALERIHMLDRAESIKIFMCGVVEATREDVVEVRKRTEKWQSEREA